jgi:hypothetical protein
MWSFLQQEDQREVMNSGCNRTEMVARNIFNGAADRCTIELLTNVLS